MHRTSPGDPPDRSVDSSERAASSAGAPAEARVGPPRERRAPRVVPGAGRIRREALDPEAVHVVERLQRMGHEAYLVGGCVRDLLLGLEPKDFDVATDAPPNRIKRLFRNAFVIGRRFRLVHVRFADGKVVETATFRAEPGAQVVRADGAEGPITDDNVFGDAEQDAFRRDFTVNALFYDPTRDRVVDYVGGLEDVESRTLRSIGDPETRLREDPVRMIRAVHFAARLGGRLEPALEAAIVRCAGEIEKASRSRLYVELMKILGRGAARRTLKRLYELGVLKPWLPELVEFFDRPIEWPGVPGGTHEAASHGEPEDTPASHLTWNLLGAADAWGLAARGAPESLQLAVLCGPWLLDSWERGPRRAHELGLHVEETFRPVALRMSIPRRASYELREILWMLGRLKDPPEQKRRLRSLVEKPIFPEALAYYGLELRARDHDAAPVERWRAIADEVWRHEQRHRNAPPPHASTDGWPQAEGDGPVRDLEEEPFVSEGEGRPARRRRRGGRGRGRGGRGPRAERDGGPADAAASDATSHGSRPAPDEPREPRPTAPVPPRDPAPRAAIAPPTSPAPTPATRAPAAPPRPPAGPEPRPFGAGLA